MRSIMGRMPFSGAGMLFACPGPDRQWQVLLFLRAVEPDIGRWSVAGGRQEPGETPLQTALREAAEEAFNCRRRPAEAALSVVEERLAGYLPAGFDTAACRSTTIRWPFFRYRTFLVELTAEPPPSLFTPDPYECDGCVWFPARSLPADAHFLVPRTVRKLGLV